MRTRPTAEREDLKPNETHEGFTVTCDECQSNRVVVKSDVGFSEESGGWGAVVLVCLDCNSSVDLWRAS